LGGLVDVRVAGLAVLAGVCVVEEAFEVDCGCRGEQLQLDEAGAAALARSAPWRLSSEIAPSACAWRSRAPSRPVRVRIRSRAATAASCLAPGWGGINAVAFSLSRAA